MRFARFITAAAMAWLLAVTFSAAPTAQGPMSDADYDKLMKSVGATIGSLRKNVEAQATDGIVADAKKMTELMKSNQTFWTQRKNTEAADWAKGAAEHAAAIEKGATAKDMAAVGDHTKQLMATCQTCHMKNRDKAADGTYILKKQ
jgi:cytochrome c556